MPEPPVDIYGRFDEDDPRYQVKLLSRRLDQVVREKEAIEETNRDLIKRLEVIEKAFQRGIGGVAVLMFIGGLIAFLLAYPTIFAPWKGK